MRTTTVLIVAVALLALGLPNAAAQSASVSGGCNDDGGQDGGVTGNTIGVTLPKPVDLFANDEADVGADGTTLDLADVLDAVNAVGNLAEGAVWDGQGPSNNCDGGGWIGVFAGGVAVCYDGGVNGPDCQAWDGQGAGCEAPSCLIADGD
jgi:hypothetical protein